MSEPGISSPPSKQDFRGVIFKMLSNASWLTGARLAGDLISLLLFIILSRHYGPAGIGQYAYGLAIAGLAYAAVNLGLEEYAIRECSRLEAGAQRILMGRLVGTQVAILVFVMCAVIFFILITRPSFEIVTIIFLLSVYQITMALVRTYYVPAFSKQLMTGPALTELCCRMGSILAVIFLVIVLKTPLEKALIPFPLGGILLVIFSILSAKRHSGMFKLKISWNDAADLVRAAWPFAASVIIYHIYARADLIMISLMMGDESAGIYAPCLKFLEVGAIPIFFIGLAMYPALSRLFENDKNDFVEAANNFHRTILVTGGLLTWALLFLLPIVLVPILGEKFFPAVSIVKFMAMLCLFMALETTLVRLLLAANLQVVRIKYQFYGMLVNVIFNILMIPIIGIIGAVMASIVAEILMCSLFFRALGNQISTTSLWKITGSFAVSLAAVFIVGVLVIWLTSNQWLCALATLATFFLALFLSGFFQIAKMRQCLSTVD